MPKTNAAARVKSTTTPCRLTLLNTDPILGGGIDLTVVEAAFTNFG